MDSDLREHVQVNQFVLAAGCDRDTAVKCLKQAEGNFQVSTLLRAQHFMDRGNVSSLQMALSLYFQESTVPRGSNSSFPVRPTGQIPTVVDDHVEIRHFDRYIRL